MYRSTKSSYVLCVQFIFILMAALSCGVHAQSFPNVGRTATPAEISAWDIDVRPDFKGLPKGAGTVSKGQQVWDDKCASCHGSFGESNEVFTPIVGGTSKDDIKTGRVESLSNNKQPQRTTLMKVPTISTLWDYINRAMPWTAPKSLTVEEVYAVTAYILFMGEIIPEDFTLSDSNIGDVQKLMPNRNGMTIEHGMRDVSGNPDVKSTACMKDCSKQLQIHSSLPDIARPAHGNLQQQNRHFGAVRGADTLRPALAQAITDGSRRDLTVRTASPSATTAQADAAALAKQHGCLACHGVANKIVGPAMTDIAKRYQGQANATQQLSERVRKGSSGNWGSTPMPPQTQVSDKELNVVLQWVLAGAK